MSNRTYTRPAALVLAAFLIPLLLSGPVQADIPDHLAKVHHDWVCVTDGALVEGFAPLVAHREGQGLSSLVLSLEEVIRWSPAGEDTMTTLRWLSGVVVNQWSANYLLLGGSHAMLPAPIHRLETPYYNYDHPTDAYYRCLDGDWDVDGDGLYAEWEVDAAELTPHLKVGRLPVNNLAETEAAVAKIIAFEQRVIPETPGGLVVASLMDPFWQPGDMYPTPALAIAMGRRDFIQDLCPDLRLGTLFQSDENVPPEYNALNPVSLADSLSARPHDFVFFQLNGIGRAWELANGLTIQASALDPVAGCGHAFMGAMVSGSVADTREPGIISHLLTMSDGGAVAFAAPTGMGYLSFHDQFQDFWWTHLLTGSAERIGDVFHLALNGFLDLEYAMISPRASTYLTFALLGDPATLIDPLPVAPVPEVTRGLSLQAVPNPFNPATTLHFTLDRSQHVKLVIHDVRGRHVATLVDREMGAGPQSIPWNARAASGVYFARITVGGVSRAVKLTLVE